MRIVSFKTEKAVDVAELEQVAGFSLPEEYKAFLQQFNGGLVDQDEPVALELLGLEETVYLQALFGMDTEIPDFDLFALNAIYEESAPENSMLIGATTDGGLLFILHEDSGMPVLYWDRNLSLEYSTEDENAYFISWSLAEFMGQLGSFELSEHTIKLL